MDVETTLLAYLYWNCKTFMTMKNLDFMRILKILSFHFGNEACGGISIKRTLVQKVFSALQKLFLLQLKSFNRFQEQLSALHHVRLRGIPCKEIRRVYRGLIKPDSVQIYASTKVRRSTTIKNCNLQYLYVFIGIIMRCAFH